MLTANAAMFVAEETLSRFAARDGNHDPATRREAERLYAAARSRAALNAILQRLRGRLGHLQPLDGRCGGHEGHYSGLQTVSIRSIRGSEDRCRDFDTNFCPLQTRTRERWLSVANARIEGRTLPPVELIQVGDQYFVRDGHHRVSVARALGEREIEAEVTARSATGAAASPHEERMAVLREQSAQLTAAQEGERQRIARELHDGLLPSLASLNIQLHTLSKRLAREGHPLANDVNKLADQVQESSQEVLRLIHDLRPVALDELGLVPALREQLEKCQRESGLLVELSARVPERLPAAVETALFRIVQEAVTNVSRHARARHVRVALLSADAQVRLDVADDGQGFDTQLPRSGNNIGLWSMCKRVEHLGGQYEVRSVRGEGTTVTAVVPL
jgi:signal transduction histidine kinase